jgi:hypothetical protein
MTNSFTDPPESSQSSPRRRRILESDEWIAIIVALTTIAAILFWAFAQRKEGLLTQTWNKILPSRETTAKTAANLDEAQIKAPLGEQDILNLQTKTEEKSQENLLIPFPKTQLESEPILSEDTTLADINEEVAKQPQVRLPLVPLPAVTTIPGKQAAPNVIPSPQGEQTVPEVPKTPETPTGEEIKPTPSQQAPTPETQTPKQPIVAFKDIPQNYWATPFISALAANKLVQGTSDNIFEPEKPINRAEMAALISEAFVQKPSLESKNFKDVAKDNAIATNIDKAVRTGFMRGYSNDVFQPEEDIPRYQVLVALVSGLKLQPTKDVDTTLNIFTDAEELPNWARNQVAAAIENGLLVNPPGLDVNNLKPNQPATRAEVAAMIHQALVKSGKLKEVFSEYIVPSP